MKRNSGDDFGSVELGRVPNPDWDGVDKKARWVDGNTWFFRCRSFVDIKTGKVLAQRTQQSIRLGDTGTYKNLKSPSLHTAAGIIRSRLIAWETAAANGQVVASDGTVPAPPPPPIAPNGDITVAEFFERVFIPAKRALKETGDLAAVTFDTYNNYWRMFLKKHFNWTLTFKNYQSYMGNDFLKNLRKRDGTHYGRQTIVKIHSVASTIFTEAIENGYLDGNVPPRHNPWKDIKRKKLPSLAAEQGVAYSETEVETIIRNLDLELGAGLGATASRAASEARDNRIRNAQVALSLGIWAGLRPSETAALRWENVNIAQGTLSVCESVVNGVHAKRTKTGEERVVTYLEPLVPILAAWHKRQGSPKEGLVLTGTSGKHVNLGGLSNEIIAPNCKKHGGRWEGFYGCRRGCGSLLVQVGATVAQGAKFLGNTVAVFEKNYWVDKGEASAEGARIYRQHKLAKARAAEVTQGLTEQKKLQGELAAFGIGDEQGEGL